MNGTDGPRTPLTEQDVVDDEAVENAIKAFRGAGATFTKLYAMLSAVKVANFDRGRLDKSLQRLRKAGKIRFASPLIGWKHTDNEMGAP